MIKNEDELKERVREKLRGDFTSSEFMVEAVRQIELSLPPAPEGYKFDARYYHVTPAGSGFSGQILVRRGREWIGQKDGRRYFTIADYISYYISSWWHPCHVARGMVEAYFSRTLSTGGVDAIFGRGGLDNYRLANWWAKP